MFIGVVGVSSMWKASLSGLLLLGYAKQRGKMVN
jgi:hypothetical protein